MAARAAAQDKPRPTLVAKLAETVRLWTGLFAEHNLMTYASAIARQAAVALVALTLVGLGLLGAAGETEVWRDQIAPQIASRVLDGVYVGIDQTVEKIFDTSSAPLIMFAALYAIWAGSGVVRACMGALDQVYETRDERPWWIRFPLSFALAAVLIFAILGAILLIVAGKHWGGGASHTPVTILRWLAAIALVDLAFDLLVRFAPAERRATKWATAGASLVVAGWIAESLFFRWYVSSVADFKTAVGSLAVFLVFMAYLYTGSIILLVGIELDELLRKKLNEERHIVEHLRSWF